jgi:hypothetical protein
MAMCGSAGWAYEYCKGYAEEAMIEEEEHEIEFNNRLVEEEFNTEFNLIRRKCPSLSDEEIIRLMYS